MHYKSLVAGFGILAAVIGAASCYYYDPGVAAGPVRSAYDPGYAVSNLPRGHQTELVGGVQYYYHDGTYYRNRGGRYIVVERPTRSRWGHRDSDRDGIRNRHDRRPHRPDGARVYRRLPDGYRTVRRGGREYYRVGNDYYVRRDGGYVIVDRF